VPPCGRSERLARLARLDVKVGTSFYSLDKKSQSKVNLTIEINVNSTRCKVKTEIYNFFLLQPKNIQKKNSKPNKMSDKEIERGLSSPELRTGNFLKYFLEET